MDYKFHPGDQVVICEHLDELRAAADRRGWCTAPPMYAFEGHTATITGKVYAPHYDIPIYRLDVDNNRYGWNEYWLSPLEEEDSIAPITLEEFMEVIS